MPHWVSFLMGNYDTISLGQAHKARPRSKIRVITVNLIAPINSYPPLAENRWSILNLFFSRRCFFIHACLRPASGLPLARLWTFLAMATQSRWLAITKVRAACFFYRIDKVRELGKIERPLRVSANVIQTLCFGKLLQPRNKEQKPRLHIWGKNGK